MAQCHRAGAYLVEVVMVVHVLGAASEDTPSACELALRVGLRLAPDGVAGPFALLNRGRRIGEVSRARSESAHSGAIRVRNRASGTAKAPPRGRGVAIAGGSRTPAGLLLKQPMVSSGGRGGRHSVERLVVVRHDIFRSEEKKSERAAVGVSHDPLVR